MLWIRALMSYSEPMTPGWTQLVKTAGCMLITGSLISCSSFNSPLSNGNYQTAASHEKKAVSVRTAASDQPMTIIQDMTFDWPVDSARMTRGFLPNKRKPHLGIDLAAPKGTPILAAQEGTVIYAGREFRGYGKMVLIESGEGWATLYAHFDKILVSEGQKVRKGEVVGAMGRTGRATGVHLHFEIRHNRGPIDPLPLLPHVATARN
ncbi:M23 family metallopeptidase [Bdellovibrio svalbardensis]|uniref:M23 family metallopeptidase n=1 Tax=Bdellovibrio svalbardensis TaxID=2972972 RepID=A0ABT6DIK9_9BACT|nr:M23 family metallopeptidase [Bdellovibrio svalbardensis]MDG0816606.1 M23 family metallopeptidase [Bdellovibrio svalbardensis]